MKTINLLAKSRDQKSLSKFLIFLNAKINKNFFIKKKYFQKIKSKTIFSVLKSPHINKTAQEQFETTKFNTQLKLNTFEMNKVSEFLKTTNSKIFPEIHVKYKISYEQLNQKLYGIQKFLVADHFQSHFLEKKEQIKRFTSNKFIQTNLLINTLDSFGKFA